MNEFIVKTLGIYSVGTSLLIYHWRTSWHFVFTVLEPIPRDVSLLETHFFFLSPLFISWNCAVFFVNVIQPLKWHAVFVVSNCLAMSLVDMKNALCTKLFMFRYCSWYASQKGRTKLVWNDGFRKNRFVIKNGHLRKCHKDNKGIQNHKALTHNINNSQHTENHRCTFHIKPHHISRRKMKLHPKCHYGQKQMFWHIVVNSSNFNFKPISTSVRHKNPVIMHFPYNYIFG